MKQWRAVLAAALASCSACSFGGGPTGARQLWTGGVTSPGVKLNARAHVLTSRSLALGTEWQVDAPEGQVADEWKGSLLGGFSRMPLPHTFPVGWEVTGAIGGTRLHLRDINPFALHAGATVGLPLRLWPSAPPWQAANDSWELLVVPEVSSLALRPLGNVDHSLLVEVSAGLSVRGYYWWNVAP